MWLRATEELSHKAAKLKARMFASKESYKVIK